jgi:hypothetical protein
MVNYANSKVYKIWSPIGDKIYVGSTIQSLAVRLGGHKRDSLKHICMNRKLYIEVNNDWSNWYIELYENYSCENREQLLKREGEIIRLIGTLNSKIEGRDRKQYSVDNADIIKEYKKQYYKNNADIINEKKKEYNVNNVILIKEYQKQYKIENADKIREYQKQYRIKKKEQLV